MKNYLSFLNDIIIKEEDYTYKLKNKKRNIVESIKHLNEKIEKYKNIKNQCLDIKNFLLKVKGGNPNKNLSPLKEIKKRLDIIQLTDIRKTPKKMENKFKLELTSDKKINNHYTTKKLKIFNHLIFSDPDEFMTIMMDILKQLGEDLPEKKHKEVAEEGLMRFDLDNNGTIDYNEFFDFINFIVSEKGYTL